MAGDVREQVRVKDAAVARHPSPSSRLGRPGAIAGLFALVAFVVFSWPTWQCVGDAQTCLAPGFLAPEGISAWLDAAARIGIVGAAVCLLMIAGEIDLSVGAVVGGAGLVATLGMSELGLTPILAALLAFGFALLVGLLNGVIVTRTGMPSLLVTLGTLLVVRGVTLGASDLIADSGAAGGTLLMMGDPVAELFGGSVSLGGIVVSASALWSLLLSALAAWLLSRTTFGNWILGTGGNAAAAREAGVPVARVKVALFMATAASAALLALVGVFSSGIEGRLGPELLAGEAIAASALGGTLLAGGAGSPVGALVGALGLGMTQVGLPLAGAAAEWYVAIVGSVILIAAATAPATRRRLIGQRAA